MHATSYTALRPHTTFLYPVRRQFPIDDVCENIVRFLEKRNWKVPGIQVEFLDYGTGEVKYRHVRIIKGEDFRLCFSIDPSRIRWEDRIPSIGEMIIPQRELHVYEDESGPTFYAYAGADWTKDKETFMKGLKYSAQWHDEPRTYLKYTGRCGPLDENGHSDLRYRSARNPFLVNVVDHVNQYKACGQELRYFHTDQIFQEVNEWLKKNVLARIEAEQEATRVELITEPVIPYPEHVGPFYLSIDWQTYQRISQGKTDKNQLKPAERYALTGGGRRLVPLGIGRDSTVPERAYDGFKYCSLKMIDPKEIDKHCAVLRINPKNANHIFVADNAAGHKYEKLCIEAHPEQQWLIDKEHNEYQRCIGRTIIPIQEYKGNYECPVILIGEERELSFDEVEIVYVKEITEKMQR